MVLLEDGEGEEPDGPVLGQLRQTVLQQRQTALVVLRLEHEANVVERDAALREEVVVDQTGEEVGGLVAVAQLRHDDRRLHDALHATRAVHVKERLRALDHAVDVAQTLLHLHALLQQRLVAGENGESAEHDVATAADVSLVHFVATPFEPDQIARGVLLGESDVLGLHVSALVPQCEDLVQAMSHEREEGRALGDLGGRGLLACEASALGVEG